MQEINIEKEKLITVSIIIVALILAIVLFWPRERIASVNETIELCERENPNYNPEQECAKYESFKYPQKECTYRMINTVTSEFGSCRDCLIECYG